MLVLVGTITVTDLAPGSYTLNLGKYYPSSTNFMDYDGNILDSQLTFGTATVNVTPEPASLILLLGGAAGLMIRRRRRK